MDSCAGRAARSIDRTRAVIELLNFNLVTQLTKIRAQRRAVILLPLLSRSGAGVMSCIRTLSDYFAQVRKPAQTSRRSGV